MSFFFKCDDTKCKYGRLGHQRVVCYKLHIAKEGLQGEIDKVNDCCSKWKVDINTKITKITIFNKRGNKLIKSKYYVKGKLLENVKTYKFGIYYIGKTMLVCTNYWKIVHKSEPSNFCTK